MFTMMAKTILILMLSLPQCIFSIITMVGPKRTKLQMMIGFLFLKYSEEFGGMNKGPPGLVREGSEVKDWVGVAGKSIENLSEDRGLKLLSQITSEDKQSEHPNMKGQKLIIAHNNAWPYFISGSVSEDGQVLEPPSGMENSILTTLSATLNFTYELSKSVDGTWGNVMENGTVTGVIGMVARGDADLAICRISVTHSRFSVVDFLWPYQLDTLTILSRAAAPKSRELAVFSPFTPTVWLCLIITTLLIGPVVKVVSFGTEIFLQKSTGSLQIISFNLYRNIVNQGNLVPTYLWSQRVLLFFWYGFCLLFSALYSGTLTAVLAITSYEKPIDSLADLPRAISQGFTVGTLAGSSMESLFKNAKEGIFKDTWNLFNHKNPSKSFIKQRSEAYDKVAAEKFAFICPLLSAETISRKLGPRKFHIARETFSTEGVSFACPKAALFQDAFNLVILRMTEGGLIQKWEADELIKISHGDDDSEGSAGPQPIKLIHLQAAFFVLVLGYSVATIVLAWENTYHFCCLKQSNLEYSKRPGRVLE